MRILVSEMKTWGFIKLAIVNLAVLNFTAVGQIHTYNLVSEFSDQSNPSGVWSYGKTSSGAATFDIFTTKVTGAWADGCFLYRGSTVCAPAVSYNDGTQILNWGNIGEPVIHLGKWTDNPGLAVLRFTAPNAGDYTIRITARSSRGTDDMVIRTNGQTAYAATLGSIIHFTNSLSLAVGDTLDIVGSGYNDFAGYQLNGVYLSGSVTLDSGTALPGITFIPAGGYFTNSLSVVMQNNLASGVIRFTTNGTNPTASSTVYPGPIQITSATEFRAMVFDNTSALSPV